MKKTNAIARLTLLLLLNVGFLWPLTQVSAQMSSFLGVNTRATDPGEKIPRIATFVREYHEWASDEGDVFSNPNILPYPNNTYDWPNLKGAFSNFNLSSFYSAAGGTICADMKGCLPSIAGGNQFGYHSEFKPVSTDWGNSACGSDKQFGSATYFDNTINPPYLNSEFIRFCSGDPDFNIQASGVNQHFRVIDIATGVYLGTSGTLVNETSGVVSVSAVTSFFNANPSYHNRLLVEVAQEQSPFQYDFTVLELRQPLSSPLIRCSSMSLSTHKASFEWLCVGAREFDVKIFENDVQVFSNSAYKLNKINYTIATNLSNIPIRIEVKALGETACENSAGTAQYTLNTTNCGAMNTSIKGLASEYCDYSGSVQLMPNTGEYLSSGGVTSTGVFTPSDVPGDYAQILYREIGVGCPLSLLVTVPVRRKLIKPVVRFNRSQNLYGKYITFAIGHPFATRFDYSATTNGVDYNATRTANSNKITVFAGDIIPAATFVDGITLVTLNLTATGFATKAKSPQSPDSYLEYSDWVYQYATKFGAPNSAINSNWLKYPGNPGLNQVKYMEIWNEQDKWWLTPRNLGEFKPKEYAAMLSAAIDGNGTINPIPQGTRIAGNTTYRYDLGIKKADPTMKIIMGGISELCPDYLNCMVSAMAEVRGDNTLPFDVLNFHHYSDGKAPCSSTGSNCEPGAPGEAFGAGGISPEADHLRDNLIALKTACANNTALQGKEIWLTEYGYDTNTGSQQQAPGIGGNGNEEVQGQWITRSILEGSASGIGKMFLYDLRDAQTSSSAGLFSSSGLLRDASTGFAYKKSYFYVSTLKYVLGDCNYSKDITPGTCSDLTCQNCHIPHVLKYRGAVRDNNGTVHPDARVYAFWMPTSCAQDIAYDIPIDGEDNPATVGESTLVKMESGDFDGVYSKIEKIQNGNNYYFHIDHVTERPQYIILDVVKKDPATLPCVTMIPPVSISCNMVGLEWSLPPNTPTPSRYVVYYKEVPGATCGGICPETPWLDLFNNAVLYKDNLPGTATKLSITGLMPSKQYCFYVFPVFSSPGGTESLPEKCAGRVGCTLADGRLCKARLGSDFFIVNTGSVHTPARIAQIAGLFDNPPAGCNCSALGNGVPLDTPYPWDYSGALDNSFEIEFIPVNWLIGPHDWFLKSMSLYDVNGIGNFKIEVKLTGANAYIPLETYLTTQYLEWHNIVDNIPTQGIKRIRFTMMDENANIARIIICARNESVREPSNDSFRAQRVQRVGSITKQVINNETLRVYWTPIYFTDDEQQEPLLIRDYAIHYSTTSDIYGLPQSPQIKMIHHSGTGSGEQTDLGLQNANVNMPVIVTGIVPQCSQGAFSHDETRAAADEKLLTIIPNPASDFLMLQTGFTDEIKVELYGSDGRRLQMLSIEGGGGQLLDVSAYPKGMVFVRARLGAKVECYKVVIQ